MISNRNKKITIIALVATIFIISIGFAAFSNTLNIATTAQVTPSSSSFSVVFSKSNNSIDATAVVPTKTPSTLTANNGTINNATNPTLSNLGATFTAPGQKVEYDLYVYNAGAYVAYLNSVTFNGTKSCTPGSGTTASYVTQACNSINMSVKIGNDTYLSTTQNISGHNLSVGGYESIKITIEYASNGARADGSFTVSFPDVSLYYRTISGVNEPVNNGGQQQQQEQEEDEDEYIYIYRNTEDNISIGDALPDFTSGYETEETKENITTNSYLKHAMEGDFVVATYACIRYIENNTQKEACVRGGDGGASYGTYDGMSSETVYSVTGATGNIGILSGIISYFTSIGGYCDFSDSSASCDDENSTLGLFADVEGFSNSYDYESSWSCSVSGYGGESVCSSS